VLGTLPGRKAAKTSVVIQSISEAYSKIVLIFKAVLAVLINPPLWMKL
jgi:hypothetical protein